MTTTVAALAAASWLGAAEPEQASIPFATTTGIDGWRAVDDKTLYIRSGIDDWYRADLFAPCPGLQFDPAIGFVVRFGSSFDRTSSILVDGQECKLRSLVKVDGPPPTERDKRTAKAEQPATPKQSEKKASGSADPAESSGESRIPFANLGSIRDWRAISDEQLYIRGAHDQWYRATLMHPCTGLRFEETIGFVVEPSGDFDRFSSIVVDGRECPVKSLTRSEPPPSRREASAERG